MKVSGFCIIRNGSLFDYPYLESLESLIPLVDELVINVGRGEDDTLEKVQQWAKELSQPKVVVFESFWPLDDPEEKKGGKILADQTNLALARTTGDWCLYLQSDEVIHEEDYALIREALQKADQNPLIDGLLFDYLHFYGSYHIVQHTRRVYRREVRAIRRSSQAQSVQDAQSFRRRGGQKLNVIRANARIFHYGWVREPHAMREKVYFADQLYHGNPASEKVQTRTPHTGTDYQYKNLWGLKAFQGTHPQTMQARIQSQSWSWNFDAKNCVPWKALSWKNRRKRLLDFVEDLTGHRFFEYRSYKLKS